MFRLMLKHSALMFSENLALINFFLIYWNIPIYCAIFWVAIMLRNQQESAFHVVSIFSKNSVRTKCHHNVSMKNNGFLYLYLCTRICVLYIRDKIRLLLARYEMRSMCASFDENAPFLLESTLSKAHRSVVL